MIADACDKHKCLRRFQKAPKWVRSTYEELPLHSDVAELIGGKDNLPVIIIDECLSEKQVEEQVKGALGALAEIADVMFGTVGAYAGACLTAYTTMSHSRWSKGLGCRCDSAPSLCALRPARVCTCALVRLLPVPQTRRRCAVKQGQMAGRGCDKFTSHHDGPALLTIIAMMKVRHQCCAPPHLPPARHHLPPHITALLHSPFPCMAAKDQVQDGAHSHQGRRALVF
jgi:hypothetical protein